MGWTADGGKFTLADPDGYVYVYGYRDGRPRLRQLVIARVVPEDLARLDRWTYFAGNGQWSSNIEDCFPVTEKVSTELSVTPIPFGPRKGKYALIYTPGTIGKKIGLRIGPFGEERIIFEDSEAATLGERVFTYNAKAHPVLSTDQELIVSYNLNSNDDSLLIFREPNIYFPRFVKIRWDEL